MNTKHCIDTCNSLLRGERSAVETYDQALEKYRDKPEVTAELSRIRAEHADAVRQLEDNVRSMGGTPDTDSGAWGAFAQAVQGAANLFGAGSALESLQQGEKSGERDYENALEDEEVMPVCKNLITSKLLPPVREHVSRLGALQRAA
jgi:uncharacterized protein (TIGR02284 family)